MAGVFVVAWALMLVFDSAMRPRSGRQGFAGAGGRGEGSSLRENDKILTPEMTKVRDRNDRKARVERTRVYV
jgi:hypothetical protein